jgi:hypothetical protein
MYETTRPQPKDVEYEEEEYELEEQMHFDTSDIEVKPFDGLLIGGDDEQVKLLFYYTKPGSSIDCRCVIELRTSRTQFIAMADQIYSHLVEHINDNRMYG